MANKIENATNLDELRNAGVLNPASVKATKRNSKKRKGLNKHCRRRE